MRRSKSLFGPVFVAGLVLALPAATAQGHTAETSAGSGAAVSIPVDADDSTGEADLTDEARMQEPLLEEMARVEELVGDLPDFGDLNVNFETGTVELLWRGNFPAALEVAVNQVLRFADLRVESVKLTDKVLGTLLSDVTQAATTTPELTGLAGISPADDFNGVVVYTTSTEVDTSDIRNWLVGHTMLTSDEIAFEFKQWATSITPAVAGSRQDDNAPFIGGARIRDSNSSCTSGFAVRNDANTVRGMLTARHCGAGEVWETPQGAELGVANLSPTDGDIMGIMWPVSTPGYPGFSGRVYYGGYTSSTMGGIQDNGAPAMDELECVSGSFSGATCNNRVFEKGFYSPVIGGPNHITRQTRDNPAAGNGDSGGPSYTLGDSRRVARGIISAISTDADTTRPCKGVPSGNGRRCSTIVFHATLQPFLNETGLRVMQSAY